ncbi:hypothetical protein K493DRAFT_307330 [Basidiobolus meristosporus CBS 931.73]|uniref:MICOS complex subunit n=1 Tax=Basidiobolus meristosporus CBS 931.73 TaxID=1314790 RepID=A0A1Y1XIH0_9FUNG|nr:hypothetical protein K493DRAFT_307330 [Basidiobolus meristosporus CBS 931.73]|eukprot:ORX85166.1 hypothetical protein K493DRAFT_307330 [Basidiobolus meristosporus CBS 931.73]
MVEQLRPEETKLSIYDEPVVPVVVIEESTRLETLGRHLRGVLKDNLNYVQNQVQGLVNEWIRVEQRVETTVKQIVPRTEKVFPGAFYILVSGMAGSIFARKRNVLFKIAAPITFATASSFYFLPKTSRSVTFHLLRKFDENKVAKAEVAQVKNRLTDVASDISHKVSEVSEGIGAAADKQKAKVEVLVEEVQDAKSKVTDTVSEVIHETKKQVEKVVENSKESIGDLVTSQQQSTETEVLPAVNSVQENSSVIVDQGEKSA